VRLITTITVLPMHSAVLVAKQAATIDQICGGRLELGLGVGGREQDYAALGAPFAHRLARLDEQVAVMRRIWAGEPPLEGVAPVGPPPVRAGGPPLLAGSMGNKGIRRAAGWADGIIGFSFGPDPAEVAAQFRKATEAWQAGGRAERPRLVTSCWFSLGRDGRRRMDEYVLRYLRVFGDGIAASLAPLATTTSERALREVIARTADLGADELILVPTTSDADELDRVAALL
jgi:alkanesulfonate monooxygenase SsuD/methylene tetrahydromethanopterin reductase-like flavin-dependent oxidoreductase (luciferase family)